MRLDFGREVCGNLQVAEDREWLVTNGIGGFASGTVAGLLSRRYHGLLMASLAPPLGRTLLFTKIDETVEYDGIYPESGMFYPLYTNRWADDALEPAGYHHLDRFHLEGTTPVWTYAIANALLEKRIWMQHGENSTYIQYSLRRATGPMRLEARLFVNYRNYHNTTIVNDWEPQLESVTGGIAIQIFPAAIPFYLLSDKAKLIPQFDWYEDFYLGIEDRRGQPDVEEDHIYAGLLQITLKPGDSFTVVASTQPSPNLDGTAALLERQRYEQSLIERLPDSADRLTPAVKQLVLAADQFVVKRPTNMDENGRSIIAGYHWFEDWGRDTMIALPGLTLVTGRPEVAATILRTYANFVDMGMIPNRFPDEGEEISEYNTVDATLWYIEAIRSYYVETGDKKLLADLFPTLQTIIQWYRRGTRFNIQMDSSDHLIYAGEPGEQLTWMDAKVDNWVVTHRIGKPVEINALWYNALRVMANFAREVGADSTQYSNLAHQAQAGFGRFWNETMGYCYDVLDGPDDAPDGRLRPNQLLAVSLPHSPLTSSQQRSVIDACARHLLTAHGLRTLSPDDAEYIGAYAGDRYNRDSAAHQGAVWAWLIGPFVTGHLRVYDDKVVARTFLNSLMRNLAAGGIGTVSEIFDGDAPFAPRGCIAKAASVAELLRAWKLTES